MTALVTTHGYDDPSGFCAQTKITQDNHIDLAKYFWNLYQNGKYYVDLARLFHLRYVAQWCEEEIIPKYTIISKLCLM